MKNKFLASMIIALSLTSGTVIPAFAADADNTVVILNIGKPTMHVNGAVRDIDPGNQVSPVLINDTTMVPIRAIAESMGGNIDWNDYEQKVTVTYKNNKVEVWLDKNTAVVNGQEINIAVAPTTINDRTMLPLRFVSESLGLCVNWEGSSEAISITPSNDYIAVAGGQIVNKQEYNIYLTLAKREILNLFNQSGVTSATSGNIWDNGIDGVRAGDFVKKKALDYSFKHSLLLGKARELNLILNDSEKSSVDALVSQLIQTYGDMSSADKKVREVYNVSLSEYKEFMEENELNKKFLNQQMTVSDEEIASVYEYYKSSGDKVTVQHILISTLDANRTPLSAEKQEEAKVKAENLLSKVKTGADFAALAQAYSEDPGSRDKGGLYTFGKGEMVKEFEDWSFQAKEGETGVIKTAYGYHVMKRTTEQEIKSGIRKELIQDKVDSYLSKLLSDNSSFTVINQSAYDAIEVK